MRDSWATRPDCAIRVSSYGFRPKRSTYDAMPSLGKRLASPGGVSFQWVLEGDRALSCATLPQRRCMKAVKKRVAARDRRAGLWQCLRAGVLEHGHPRATLTGPPQGGRVRPLAAHIYLDDLDRYRASTSLNLPQW